MVALLASFIVLAAACSAPRTVAAPAQPTTHTYREIDGKKLSATVFSPASKPANAILLFHGGGWSAGSADWTFDAARKFADAGLVAISIEYRLSDDKVTPIEALDDTCAAFRWTRDHAGELGVASRVAGYGVSAGGHLVAMAATHDRLERGVGPEALLLLSPALDLSKDAWFAKLLKGRAPASEYSPIEHVGATPPPTCIVQGAADTLTPLAGATRYRDRVIAAGGTCELNVYEHLGHLLTRNLANQESDFDPDPVARAAGFQQQLRFLKRREFLAGD